MQPSLENSTKNKVDKNMGNIELSKATINDKRDMLSSEITSGYISDFDLDNKVVYIEVFDGSSNRYRTFKHTFTMTDTKTDISEDSVEVIRTTEFLEVENSDNTTEKSLSDKIVNVLDKYFGSSKKKTPVIDVIKQFGSEGHSMYAIEPLYIAPGEVDGHLHTMDLEGITDMVDSLNKANDEGRLQSGLFHKHKTDVWTLDKAWVNPTECMIGDQLVPEGQPIAKTLFTNKAAFNMRINGDISGLSIGARAKEVKELNKDLSQIQAKVEATHILKGVNFDWLHPELTYTSPSQGGAASLKNEAYEINKAKKAVKSDLDPEQVQILKDIGEEFISLEKHLGTGNKTTPSSSTTEVSLGEDTQVTKGSNNMSEEMVTRKEFVELQKALAVQKAVNSITGYAFDTELNKGVADAIASLNDDGQEAITKAFDALEDRSKEAVEKAIEKSKSGASKDENELTKALSKEAGDGGEPEKGVEKTLAQRAIDSQESQKGEK